MQQEIWFQKYKIIRLLGRGGTAKVYLAEHIKLKSYRAIKCISKNHPLYEFQRNEAFILKNLKHSCIPIIYDIEENEEGSYIIEQYLEGDTLKDYVRMKGQMKEEIILNFAVQICDLIHYLHSIERPILYVDLKPENIILSDMTLKLIDFGSAIYQDELAGKQDYFGTKGYAAPELYRHQQIDERCDVYGIGMLLYYMASGRAISQNFTEYINIDQISNCSKQLKNIMNHCLKFNPTGRYATVVQLKKQLSAMKQKQKFHGESSQPLTIAVAGAQPRIGVTHFAFRLCNYLINRNKRCIYQERNNSGCIRSMKSCYEDIEEAYGNYEYEKIPMFPEGKGLSADIAGDQITVNDFGCLRSDNLEQFIEAEIKLLILGAKDWELTYSEAVLDKVAEYKDISYLFNFLSGKQFQQVTKNMEQKNSYRIPYEPDPFAKITDKNGEELFDELLGYENPTGIKEGVVGFRRKIEGHR